MAEEKTADAGSSEQLLPSQTVKAAGADESPVIAAAPGAVRRSFPLGLSIAVGLLLTGLAVWFFYHLTWFILLLYLSFIVATILEAPVQWIKRLGIRRGLAAVIVMVGGLAIIGTIGWFVASGVYTQMAAVSDNLKRTPDRINRMVNDLEHHFKGPKKGAASQPVAATHAARAESPALSWFTGKPPASAPATMEAPASAPADDGDFDINKMWPESQTVASTAMSGVEAVSWLVIMFFIVLYMLVDGESHLKTLRCLLPKQSRLEATKLFNRISQAHRGWALASMTNVGSSTLLTGTGLWLLGVPGAYVLGFLAGLGEMIPNIGPLIGAVPALLLTLVAGPDKFVYVAGMFVLVWTIQGYTITPMVMKFGVELPVLVTIVSVLVMGVLFGFLGVLVAIPLVADLVVCWGYISARREKDTTDYDAVNAPPEDRRMPMSPDNTPASRIRKMFRRSKQAEAAQTPK